MAMTIMSQRECLRKIVIINFPSQNVPQLPRPPNAFWSGSDWRLFSGWRGERSRGFLNQFPCIAQMLFRGENIAESQTNHGLAAQFCLIQIRATRSINQLDDAGIERVDLVFCAKANHAHRDRRG